MVEEDRITLAPTTIYGRSDEEQSGPRTWRRKTEEPPGKCLVYSLTIIVIIFALCLILSSIFLRISKPEIETRSISTRDLRFGGNSTNPYFNVTLVSDISIRNSNFGAFEFEDSSLRVVYADHGVVGETKIEGRRVEAHKTVRITDVVVEIGSFRLLNTKDLDSDLRLGFLELRSVAEVRGRIKVLGRRRWKGNGTVSGILFDTTGINEVTISKRALRRMSNLRFLSVYKSRGDGNDRMDIPEEMEFPPLLRLLHWDAYPSKSLPLRFRAENLVELDMQNSQLEYLWQGTQSFLDGSACFHGSSMPSEFNHRARGNSLNILLTSSASSTFKACVVISPNHRQHPRDCRIVELWCRIIDNRGWYIYTKFVSLRHPEKSTGLRTKHLCIFHGIVPEVSSEAVCEFYISSKDPSDNYKITECGVQILTNETERSSDNRGSEDYEKSSYEVDYDNLSYTVDYDNSRYEFDDFNDVLEDSEDGLISCDSESDDASDEQGTLSYMRC
ncbi:unnamed protein product [Arabidopsis arenosa]|uniref:Uncharacterized protein n=1 Tax=Arabidopsis arenosa TaxID=38785 RepID=A0A8S1ZLC2_ARAAE|nr:unnamed protein product [Arabidopsis arenosa]